MDDPDALAALVAELRERTLPEHGGPAGPLHGWNLTRGDSEMHKRSADAITALIARVRAQERKAMAWDEIAPLLGEGTVLEWKRVALPYEINVDDFRGDVAELTMKTKDMPVREWRLRCMTEAPTLAAHTLKQVDDAIAARGSRG